MKKLLVLLILCFCLNILVFGQEKNKITSSDKIKVLYDGLIGDGYIDLGTFEEFTEFAKDKENRTKIYRAYKNEAGDIAVTIERFDDIWEEHFATQKEKLKKITVEDKIQNLYDGFKGLEYADLGTFEEFTNMAKSKYVVNKMYQSLKAEVGDEVISFEEFENNWSDYHTIQEEKLKKRTTTYDIEQLHAFFTDLNYSNIGTMEEFSEMAKTPKHRKVIYEALQTEVKKMGKEAIDYDIYEKDWEDYHKNQKKPKLKWLKDIIWYMVFGVFVVGGVILSIVRFRKQKPMRAERKRFPRKKNGEIDYDSINNSYSFILALKKDFGNNNENEIIEVLNQAISKEERKLVSNDELDPFTARKHKNSVQCRIDMYKSIIKTLDYQKNTSEDRVEEREVICEEPINEYKEEIIKDDVIKFDSVVEVSENLDVIEVSDDEIELEKTEEVIAPKKYKVMAGVISVVVCIFLQIGFIATHIAIIGKGKEKGNLFFIITSSILITVYKFLHPLILKWLSKARNEETVNVTKVVNKKIIKDDSVVEVSENLDVIEVSDDDIESVLEEIKIQKKYKVFAGSICVMICFLAHIGLVALYIFLIDKKVTYIFSAVALCILIAVYVYLYPKILKWLLRINNIKVPTVKKVVKTIKNHELGMFVKFMLGLWAFTGGISLIKDVIELLVIEDIPLWLIIFVILTQLLYIGSLLMILFGRKLGYYLIIVCTVVTFGLNAYLGEYQDSLDSIVAIMILSLLLQVRKDGVSNWNILFHRGK